MTFVETYIREVQDAISALPIDALVEAQAMVYSAMHVWLVGNGGSASLADHMATDLQIARISAVSLSSSMAAITSYGNDYGFEHVFSQQLKRLAPPLDRNLLFAISTSGNSDNIIEAAEYVRQNGGHVIALTGQNGGLLKVYADLWLPVNSLHTGVVQDVHEVMLHTIAYGIMEGSRG
jgi:phosphoheptose isomerase